MTDKEAKDFLTHYICSCPYGTSPTNCGDDKCQFGIAVRTLCSEEIKTGYWIIKHRTYNENKSYTGVDNNGEEHTVFVHKVYECDEPYCSECGKQAGDVSQNFCCYCGKSMYGTKQ